MIDLYFLCRRYASPLIGSTPLPCPGSPGEQPAALMDAFMVLDLMDKREGEP